MEHTTDIFADPSLDQPEVTLAEIEEAGQMPLEFAVAPIPGESPPTKADLDLLQFAVDAIAAAKDPHAVAEQTRALFSSSSVAEPRGTAEAAEPTQPPRESFGRWLIAQKDRGDWIDPIAAAARRDSIFPKDGSAEDVREHFRKMGADGDAFEALDDAELDWSCL